MPGAKVAQSAPAIILPWAGLYTFDPVWIPIVALTIIAAWFARAGQLYAKWLAANGDDERARPPWRLIWHDLIVSVMIGGGVAIIAAALISRLHLNYMEGALVTFFLAVGGVETIKIGWLTATKVWYWFVDKMFESEGARRQAAAREQAAESLQTKADLERLAHSLDAKVDVDDGSATQTIP